MASQDPLERTKNLVAQVYEACKEAGMEVEHDPGRMLIFGEDFHIKVKDVPVVERGE